MSIELYFNYVNIALSHYSVDELVKIWYDSSISKEFGDITRTLIMKTLPDIARVLEIKINEGTTFQEFVELHDEKMYKELCQKAPDECLRYFAFLGDWRNMKRAIKKGAYNWNGGMREAARGGHRDLVEFFVSKGADNWDWAMAGAAEGGHRDLVEFFISKGAVPTSAIRKKFNL